MPVVDITTPGVNIMPTMCHVNAATNEMYCDPTPEETLFQWKDEYGRKVLEIKIYGNVKGKKFAKPLYQLGL